MEQINLKNYPERFALCGLPVVKVKGRKTLEEADAKAASPVWQANPSPPIILKRP